MIRKIRDMKEEEEVYSFQYCGCIYESSVATMSLHKTKKGAYKAMRAFIEKGYAEWRDDGYLYGKKMFTYGDGESWRVVPISIQE